MRKETSDDSTYVKTTITKWSTHPPIQKRMKKKKRPNDYDIILLIRISQCKKVIRRRKGSENFKTEVD